MDATPVLPGLVAARLTDHEGHIFYLCLRAERSYKRDPEFRRLISGPNGDKELERCMKQWLESGGRA
jgi:hypothetical protein